MWKLVTRHRCLALTPVFTGFVCSASAETLLVVDASVFLPEGGDTVRFEVEFNRAPNWPLPLADVLPSPENLALGTLSDGGPVALMDDASPAESFQFMLDTAPEPADAESPAPFAWEVIVRGGEATEATGIPFRDAEAPTNPDDLAAGGWGPVLGLADFALDGSVVTFSAPNEWVGIADGGVSYELLVLSDGAVVDTFVPTPTTLAAGLALLGGGLLRRRSRG